MPHLPDLPADPAAVRAAVDAHLTDHLAGLRAELATHGPDATLLLDELAAAVSGGKRLRAALCWWSFRAHHAHRLGGSDPDPERAHATLAVGAALELFQAAALVHDDVMDGSDTRRGRPAAHRSLAHAHRAGAWPGDADSFGTAGAILLGDLALIASERQTGLAVATLPAQTARAVRDVVDRMRTEVTVGQYLDVLAQHQAWGQDPSGDEARARRVVRAKSARYSVEHPLTLGALLAGADDEAVARCRAVGLPLGEAFQLRDDLLGVYGDPSVTGKPAGDDLREGKRTVLVARALALAAPDDAEVIRAGLGRPDLSGSRLQAVRDAITRSGAVAAVDRLIDDLAGPALAELGRAPLGEPGRTELLRLARSLVDRDA